MHGQAQALRNAEANDQPDVNLSYDELLDELINHITLPVLGDGDITVKKLCSETKLSETTIHRKLKPLLESGAWRMIEKRDSRGCPVQTFVKVV
jgi:DNA-binding transcriptional ArsR family regulator